MVLTGTANLNRPTRRWILWKLALLVSTSWFSGQEQSSVNAHSSSRVRRHGTSYRAPSATLHPWIVSGRLWKHFCLHLILYIFIAACTVSLVLVCSLYGALKIVVTLLLLLLLLLSASLYFSKRGAYWDRLCRDVVGRWLLVGWLSRACTVAKRCILGL